MKYGYGCVIAILLVLAACRSSTPQQSVKGTAYAGPASLNIRGDLGSKSPVVTSVSHGEKLDVLENRRRLVKVRTKQGIEGWADASTLLSEEQMAGLRKLAELASSLPSQGAATVNDPLNVHSSPSRSSPGFFQIAEGQSVDLVAHRVTAHGAPRPALAVRKAAPNAQSKAKSKAKGSAKKEVVPPPDPPRPPVPPADWEALSRPRASDLPGYTAPVAAVVPADDWALVRTKDGKAGWVLARMLIMSIPDAVAQYAEGHRIAGYVSIGDVNDTAKNEVMHNWLWATSSVKSAPFDFDSFRVFVWSIKRHHYETAYIERGVKGYYPLETQDLSNGERAFSLVVEDKDGKLYKRKYAFSGYRVRLLEKTPFQPVNLDVTQSEASSEESGQDAAGDTKSPGWKDRISAFMDRFRKR